MPRLTPSRVAELMRSGAPCKVADGNSLYLVVQGPGRGYWVHQYRDGSRLSKNGKPAFCSHGLGSAAEVSPAQARRKREEFAVGRRNGSDTPGIRPQAAKGESFAEVAEAFLNHNSSLWGARQLARNRTLLRLYCGPLNQVPINRITTAQIADLLKANDKDGMPIWTGPGANRGGKLRGLIENIINGHANPNPATWQALKIPKYQLQLKRVEGEGHAAMPAADVPAFIKRLDMKKVEDRAILFVILTGVRRSEALGATWKEFNLAGKAWLIPAVRMKNKKDHIVALTDAVIACLGEPGEPDAFVFGSRRGTMLGHNALLLSRFGLDYDLHGFRSTLASWAEESGYRTNVIQMALAHRKKTDNGRALGSQDSAYMRATLFDERRILHDAWSAFAAAGQ